MIATKARGLSAVIGSTSKWHMIDIREEQVPKAMDVQDRLKAGVLSSDFSHILVMVQALRILDLCGWLMPSSESLGLVLLL